MKRPCFLLLALLCTVPELSAQSISVPLTDEAYTFLERCEAKGLLKGIRSGAKPISRMEMARALREIRRAQEEGARLSSIEKRRLERFMQAFREEWAALGADTSGIKQRWHLLSLKNERGYCIGDPIAAIEGRYRDEAVSGDFLRLTEGGKIRGTLKGTLGFYVDARNRLEIHEEASDDPDDYFEGQAGSTTPRGRRAFRDETNAHVALRLLGFDLQIGKDAVAWGPGYRGNLGLSDNAGSFDAIKLTARYGPITFTHLTGFLRTDLADSVRSYWVDVDERREILKEKHLAAHRLDLDLSRGLHVGLYEVVVYGERGLEPGYLLPIMFFRSHEHYLGDRDNVLMGADLILRPIRNLKLYGGLLIDDLSTERLGEHYWADIIAFTVGAHWADPLGWQNSELHLETTRTDPYLYTHHFPVNVYTHNGRILGHWSGPNAELCYVELTKHLRSDLEIQLFAEQQRHGANLPSRNVGGDVHRPHRSGDPENVHFLDGLVERRRSCGIQLTWWPTWALCVRMDYRYVHQRNVLSDSGERGTRRGNRIGFFVGYHTF